MSKSGSDERMAVAVQDLLQAMEITEQVYKEAPIGASFGRYMTDAIHQGVVARNAYINADALRKIK